MGTRVARSSIVDVSAPSSSSGVSTDKDRVSYAETVPTDATAIPSTRTARTWMRVLPALILLAVTLVFVFQNLRSAKVSFFTVSGRLPLAVALLAAAALGALIVLAVGSLRILQLRKLIHRRTDTRHGDRPRRAGAS